MSASEGEREPWVRLPLRLRRADVFSNEHSGLSIVTKVRWVFLCLVMDSSTIGVSGGSQQLFGACGASGFDGDSG